MEYPSRNHHSLVAADYGRHSEQTHDFAAVAAAVVFVEVDSGIVAEAVAVDGSGTVV